MSHPAVSQYRYDIYRVILGYYLCVHFLRLLPDGEEVFSNNGMIKDASLLPTYGMLPIFLFKFDSPQVVNAFLLSLAAASLCLVVNYKVRIASAWLFWGWICLFNRNPFISNPSLAFIGWILLSFVVAPKSRKTSGTTVISPDGEWIYPDVLYYGMWAITAVSYTASGLHKLSCPSWIDGSALQHVLTSLLARDNIFVKGMLSLPPDVLKIMSWTSLFGEISFLFFGVFKHLRKWYWNFFLLFHIGILCTVDFTDLTLGMLVAHLFLFDERWTWNWIWNWGIWSWKCSWTKGWRNQPDRVWSGVVEVSHLVHSQLASERCSCTLRVLSNSKNSKSYKAKKIASGHCIISDPETSPRVLPTIPDKEFSKVATENFNMWFGRCFIASLIVIGSVIYLNSTEHFLESVAKLGNITMQSLWGFALLAVILGGLMLLERRFPDQTLEDSPGWWKWVVGINTFQLFSVVIETFTWEKWLRNTSYFTSTTGFHLRDHVSPFMGGLIAYLVNTWLFYWWHYFRHQIYLFWVIFHQFHHSPKRIETITSFYKHPLEIIIDSQIMAALLYSVLGLTEESSVW